ncbi:nucleoside monophosphate kinase [Candidatus Peregrinibacteria bacterium]|nr:nucleoside monophosphate kinase [Candidatus Peregrinibacteria bacterium]
MDYVLFGIQGSGKGTQGKFLAEKLPAAYFETGGELRRLAQEKSPLGQKVKNIIETGHLVPTETVMEIVENFTNRNLKKAIIFDGIPRNADQNRLFVKLLERLRRPHTGIYFELSREEAQRRLLTRRICAGCKSVYPALYPKEKSCETCGGHLETRRDDNPESIRTRLDIFYQETVPIIEEWKNAGKMISIDASPTIEEVTKILFERTEKL